jgi:plasmid maintenance system antidote protein VapI
LGPAISPGEILLEEYLKPLGVGQLEAAKRLGRFLKTSQQLWMRLQADWDLHQAMQREARQAS